MTVGKFENLEVIFDPHNVAVVGASKNPGKLGHHVMRSLTEGGFQGEIVPINPGDTELFGCRAYPSVLEVPQQLDLAIVVLPAQLVPDIFEQCAKKGVRGIILITAGFKEIENQYGGQLQEEIAELANEAGMKVIGPNSFGVVNLEVGLNASFTPEFSEVRSGGISLVSQSGGMAHLIAFRALEENVGFNKIIGVGNRCNVDFADLLEYLMQDQGTQLIAMYMEGTNDLRSLMGVAQQARGEKPIIVYKVGRSPVSDKVSRLHTGSLAGQYEVYQEAFKQVGILAVHSSEELLDTAKILVSCPLPKGNKVAVLSGQAGPAMAACDVCQEKGLALAVFSKETQTTIQRALPPMAIRTNPVDMGPAWYDPGAIREVVGSVLSEESVHGMVLLIAYASANSGAVESLADLLKSWGRRKPIVCCLSSPRGIWDQEIRSLEEEGVPNFPTPERAARALANLWNYQELAATSLDHESH